jgi:ACS family tartrate transporter-like MFS transporter
LSDISYRDSESSVLRKLTWRLVPFLFLLYVVAYLDRINVGFAALQMQRQLHFTDAVYGLGAGMFFVGYLCFQVPSNLMLQRIGARRWIAVLMVTWGVISSAMVFVNSPRSFYAFRFLLGSAEAGFFPGVILYLRNWFPASARARTVARFMTAAPLAGLIGGPVSGALLNLHPGWGLGGWQWLFLVEGVPAILLGCIAWRYLTDRPDEAFWLPGAERNWLLDALRREYTGATGSGPNARPVLWNGQIWMLAVAYFGVTTAMYGVGMWLPNVLHSVSGVNNFTIGLLSAIPYLAASVAMVGVGLHSDQSGERRWHAALPAFVASVALLGAAYSGSVYPSIFTISVATLATFSMMGPFWAIPTGLLSGAEAAVGIALINSVGNLGGLFGPYVIGWVRTATSSFRGGLLAVGASVAMSGVVVLLVRESTPRR